MPKFTKTICFDYLIENRRCNDKNKDTNVKFKIDALKLVLEITSYHVYTLLMPEPLKAVSTVVAFVWPTQSSMVIVSVKNSRQMVVVAVVVLDTLALGIQIIHTF